MAQPRYDSFKTTPVSKVSGAGETPRIRRVAYDRCTPEAQDYVSGTVTNVMGQEDLFREDPPGPPPPADATRVQNGGIARIVFSSTAPVKTFRIDYSANSRSLNQTTGPVVLDTATPTPEYFLAPVQVDSLYAFRITLIDSDGNDGDQSGVYYFTTGSTVAVPGNYLDIGVLLQEGRSHDVSLTIVEGRIEGLGGTSPASEGFQPFVDVALSIQDGATSETTVSQFDASYSLVT